MRYYAFTLILVKFYIVHLKSYLILHILPKSDSVNVGIKANKTLCDFQATDSACFCKDQSKKLYWKLLISKSTKKFGSNCRKNEPHKKPIFSEFCKYMI